MSHSFEIDVPGIGTLIIQVKPKHEIPWVQAAHDAIDLREIQYRKVVEQLDQAKAEAQSAQEELEEFKKTGNLENIAELTRLISKRDKARINLVKAEGVECSFDCS